MLDHYPDLELTFRLSGLGKTLPQIRDPANCGINLCSNATMDIKFHDGKLFVLGAASDNFLTALRRMP